MKFLISNYSTPWNTEPFYINASLSIINEQSKLFDINNSSIYDEFDNFNPNILIIHINHVSKDILHYIVNNNKKISLLININEFNISNLDKFSLFFKENKIEYTFFGFNDLDPKITNNYIKILPSADIFLNKGEQKYSIQKLIFVEDEKDIIEMDGTYHYTSINQELINKVDFIVPINIINTIFSNYKEIIFRGKSYIGSQIAFNAIYSGSKVIFDTNSQDDLEKINDIFKGGKLLSSVRNRHTCLHRTKTLLSRLNCKDIIQNLEREIEKI